MKSVEINGKKYYCNLRFTRLSILIDKDSDDINNITNYLKNRIHTFTFDRDLYNYVYFPNLSKIDIFDNSSVSESLVELRISGLVSFRNDSEYKKFIRQYKLKEIRMNY